MNTIVTNHTELGEAFDDFMNAFEAFKQTNDERLEQVEKRMSADVLTSAKLERIQKAVDEHKQIVDNLALKNHRPLLGAHGKVIGSAQMAHRMGGIL